MRHVEKSHDHGSDRTGSAGLGTCTRYTGQVCARDSPVLTQAPQSLDLCFNEAVEVKFSSVTLEDAKGTAVPLGKLQAGSDPKCINVPILTIGSGVFTVHYRVLSQDGHVVEYGYQFRIKTDAKSP